MSLFFKMRQNNDAKQPRAYKKWYARAYYPDTIDLRQLAGIMQRNSTVKRSDVLAVLCELTEAMKQELQQGRKVSIDGLGVFMIGISAKGVDHPADFRTEHDVNNLHLVFQPETTRSVGGKRCETMVSGTKLKLLPSYDKTLIDVKNEEI